MFVGKLHLPEKQWVISPLTPKLLNYSLPSFLALIIKLMVYLVREINHKRTSNNKTYSSNKRLSFKLVQ